MHVPGAVVGPVWLPRLRKLQQEELFSTFFKNAPAAVALTALTSYAYFCIWLLIMIQMPFCDVALEPVGSILCDMEHARVLEVSSAWPKEQAVAVHKTSSVVPNASVMGQFAVKYGSLETLATSATQQKRPEYPQGLRGLPL